ncbi:hypothetical protein BX616_002825, partial [Lobosporangium transversale]
MSVVPKKEYTLLWWTKWFDQDRYEDVIVDNCGLPYTCRNTLDRSKYKDARLILFHDWHPNDLPPRKDVDNNSKAWVRNS